MGKLTHNVAGSIASFRSADKANIKSLKFHFLPKQEGSGDPSPTNIRPITGWTGLNGRRAGKNIGHIVGYSAASMNSPTASRLLTNAYGTTISTRDFISPNTPLIVTQEQTSSWDPTTPQSYKNGYFCVGIDNLIFGRFYDFSFKVTNVVSNPLNASISDIKINAPGGGQKSASEIINDNIVVYRNIEWVQYTFNPERVNRCTLEFQNIGMSFTVSEIMVTPANTSDGVFEPYSGELIPITFPDGQTIYGGYINPIAGEIVAEYELLEGLWGDWPNLSDQGDGTELRYKKFTNPVYGNSINNHHTDYCNVAKYNHNNENGRPHYYIVANSYNCRMYLPSGYDTTQNVQVIGKLLTPIHIPVNPQDLQTFLDYNNFWSDANDITEVTYEFADHLSSRKTILNEPHVETAALAPVAHFETNMVAPVKELKMYFAPWQNGYGNPSPENIRSIQGHTKATIKTSGKNMLNCMRYGISGSAANISYSIHTNEEDVVDYITAVGDNDRTNLFRNLTKSSRNGLPRGTFSFNSFSNQANILPIRQDNIPSGYASAARFTSTDGGGISASRTGWFDWDINRYDQWNSWTRIQIYPNGGPGTVNTTIYPMMCHTSDRGCDFEAYHGKDYEVEFPATRNLLDTSTHETNTNITRSGITFDYNSDGTLTVNGQVDSGATTGPQYRMALWTQQETGDYYLCCGAPYSTAYNETYVYDSGLSERPKKWDGVTTSQSAASNRPLSEVHLIAGHTYSINIRINRDQDKTYVNDSFYVMLLRSTDTNIHYEPYGTVYGGYIDLVRGKIVATHSQMNLKNKSWYKYTSHQFCIDINKSLTSTSLVCDSLPISTTNGYPTNDKSIGFYSNGASYCKYLFIKYEDSEEASDFRDWINNLDTDPSIVYELATTIEYDITPQILKTLKGTNNIWSDLNGDIEVKYWTH